MAVLQDPDPVLWAFRLFNKDGSATISSNSLISLVSQIPGIGKVCAGPRDWCYHLSSSLFTPGGGPNHGHACAQSTN